MSSTPSFRDLALSEPVLQAQVSPVPFPPMIRTDTIPPRLALRLQTYWTRALVPLLLALVGLALGWQLAEGGHTRLSSASQTTPALPELRPMPTPQPSVQGVGAAAEATAFLGLAPWPEPGPTITSAPVPARGKLVVYGRMNLDGG